MATHSAQGSLTLLIAVDGSPSTDAAVGWVASLKHAGIAAHCVLVHVRRPVMSGEDGTNSPASAVLAERERGSAAILTHAENVVQETGMRCTRVERTDSDTAAALLICAQNYGCDAIVVGRHGHGALRAALFGSVSAAVVRNATQAVVVINAGVAPRPAGWFGILVAYDGSAPAHHAAAAAAQVACRAAVGNIHLMHVRPDLTVAGAIFGPRERLIQHWSGADWEQALAQARTIVEKAGCTYTVHPVFGDHPGEQILQTAEKLGCGMIAMGTRGLGPVSQLLLGSVAQDVVERARVPVLLSR